MNVTEQRLETGNAAPQEQLDAANQRIKELEQELTLRGEALAVLEPQLKTAGRQIEQHKRAFLELVKTNGEKHRRLEAAERKLATARTALEKIQRWKGEFPATGNFHEDGTPISYGVCYGSNGERDFMRMVAQQALAQIEQPQNACTG